LRCRGYKRKGEECLSFRREMLTRIRETLGWLSVPDGYSDTSDMLDALIASLTARAAVQGLTSTPTSSQSELARKEGWIHLPTNLPELGLGR
jgi:hypothetical protein